MKVMKNIIIIKGQLILGNLDNKYQFYIPKYIQVNTRKTYQ